MSTYDYDDPNAGLVQKHKREYAKRQLRYMKKRMEQKQIPTRDRFDKVNVKTSGPLFQWDKNLDFSVSDKNSELGSWLLSIFSESSFSIL